MCGHPEDPARVRRGVCAACYARARRADPSRFRRAPSLAVFWSRVDRSAGPGGCWPWTGPLTTGGYGRVTTGHGRQDLAHRVAWTCESGPPTPGFVVTAACGNRTCCNPDHLVLVTRRARAARDASGVGAR